MNRLTRIFAVWGTVVAVALIFAVGCSQESAPPIAALTEKESVLPADIHFFAICFDDESKQPRGLQQKKIETLLGSGCELLGDNFDVDGQMHRITLRLPEAISPNEVVNKLQTMQGVARAAICSLVC
jgi:hypothetical protein